MIYSITLNPSIDYIIHVDSFTEGNLNRATKEYINVGGKGIMVSKLLTNIGIENTALGFLGGFTGRYIQEWFDEVGIKHDFTRVRENTRINVKLKSKVESEINGRGSFIGEKEQRKFLSKLENISKDDTVIISGSSAPGLDIDVVDQIIEICKNKGADFAIDTTGGTLLKAMSKNPLVIKPNIDEIGELFGRKFSSKEEMVPYGRKCLEMGAKFVIVSMGSNGALFFDEDKVYYSPAVKGRLVNSVGAGDSMLAGFVGYLKSGKTPLESFKYSIAAGTGTAFCEDIATLEEVKKIFEVVEIVQL